MNRFRVAVWAPAVLFAVTLTGCSSTPEPTNSDAPVSASASATSADFSSAASPMPSTSDESTAPVVADKGWTLSVDGVFVSYGVQINNPGAATAMPSITVTSLDADGSPLETKQEYLGYIESGGDAYVGGTFINSASIADLSITTDPGQPVSDPEQAITVQAEAEIRSTGLTPQITLTAQSDGNIPIPAPARVFYVFRNVDGTIVGGANAFTQSAIQSTRTLSEAPHVVGFVPDDAVSATVTVSTSSM